MESYYMDRIEFDNREIDGLLYRDHKIRTTTARRQVLLDNYRGKYCISRVATNKEFVKMLNWEKIEDAALSSNNIVIDDSYVYDDIHTAQRDCDLLNLGLPRAI